MLEIKKSNLITEFTYPKKEERISKFFIFYRRYAMLSRGCDKGDANSSVDGDNHSIEHRRRPPIVADAFVHRITDDDVTGNQRRC